MCLVETITGAQRRIRYRVVHLAHTISWRRSNHGRVHCLQHQSPRSTVVNGESLHYRTFARQSQHPVGSVSQLALNSRDPTIDLETRDAATFGRVSVNTFTGSTVSRVTFMALPRARYCVWDKLCYRAVASRESCSRTSGPSTSRLRSLKAHRHSFRQPAFIRYMTTSFSRKSSIPPVGSDQRWSFQFNVSIDFTRD